MIRCSIDKGNIEVLELLQKENLLRFTPEDPKYTKNGGIHQVILDLALKSKNPEKILSFVSDEIAKSNAVLTLNKLGEGNISKETLDMLISIDQRRPNTESPFISTVNIKEFLNGNQPNAIKVDMLEHIFLTKKGDKDFKEDITKILALAENGISSFYRADSTSKQSFLHFLMRYDHEFKVLPPEYWNAKLGDKNIDMEDKLAIISHLLYLQSDLAIGDKIVEQLLNDAKGAKLLPEALVGLTDLGHVNQWQSVGKKSWLGLFDDNEQVNESFLQLLMRSNIDSLKKALGVDDMNKKLADGIKDFKPFFQLPGDQMLERFNLIADKLDEKFVTAIALQAILNDRSSIVEAAIKKGILSEDALVKMYVTTYNSGGKDICLKLLPKFLEQDILSRDEKIGNNILHLAVMKQDSDMIKAILNSGADISELLKMENKKGITPIEYMIIHPPKDASADIINALVKDGVDPAVYVLAYHSDNHPDFLKSLLNAAPPDSKALNALLQEAIARNDDDLIEDLIHNYSSQYREMQQGDDYLSLTRTALKLLI